MATGKKKQRSAAKPTLRRKAEARLERASARPANIPADPPRLVHELQVHQMELELQNEELRGARLAIEAGLRRYTELFDFAPLGYVVLGVDETIREINYAGARLLGRDRKKLLGARLALFLVERDWEKFNVLLVRARENEGRHHEEVEVNRGGGEHITVALSVVSLARSEATILIVLEDISDRRARQEKLENAEAALREADRRKDEFLAALSHELRNPLGPIRTSLFLLGSPAPGIEQAHRARTIIDRQVAHLSRLIDDLLDVTRIARGKIQLRRKRVDFRELVRATVEDHRAGFDSSRIRLEVRLPAVPLWVEGDADRLIQSVSNLLGNAEKYTPPDGSVVVTLDGERNEARLRVRDNGTGIAPEILAHVFEPFAQGPQTIERGRGGLGLGLAMVKGFVELHGGGVRITSQGPGLGTEVTIALPLAEEGAMAEPAPASRTTAPRRSRRVLVIDDNADAADSLADAIGFHGHQVRVAYDGPEALEIARQFLPEVVICDIGLPRMSGYAVAQAFRGDDALKRAYLVALSGYARSEDLQRAHEAGFDQHVTKPPVIEELERTISSASERPDSHMDGRSELVQ